MSQTSSIKKRQFVGQVIWLTKVAIIITSRRFSSWVSYLVDSWNGGGATLLRMCHSISIFNLVMPRVIVLPLLFPAQDAHAPDAHPLLIKSARFQHMPHGELVKKF